MFDAEPRWGPDLQRAYDALACGVVVYTDEARIAEANAAACGMLGRSLEEVRGKRMRGLRGVAPHHRRGAT